MFALIIAIVSIALVVATVVATLYFGGSSVNEGQATAHAARIINQGQQVLGAADIFHAQTGRWPASVQELVEQGFLSSVPVASLEQAPALNFAIPSAYAADGEPWAIVSQGAPAFWLRSAVPEEACRQVNMKSRGDDGIYRAAQPGVMTQCFGTSAPYTALTHRGGVSGFDLGDAVGSAGDPTKVVAADGGGWAQAPRGDSAVVVPPEPTDDVSPIIVRVSDSNGSYGLGYGSPGYGGFLMATPVMQTNTRTVTVTNISDHAGAVHARWRSYYYDTVVQYQHGLSMSSNCGQILQPGASCSVTINHTPQEYRHGGTNGAVFYSWILLLPGEGSSSGPSTDDQPEGTQVLQVNNQPLN